MTSKVVLDIYSHGVRVSGYSRELFTTLSIFLESLNLKEPRKLPAHQGGRTVMELKKRYYGLRHNNREAFIHRYQLDELIGFLHDRGIEDRFIERNYIEPGTPVEVSYTLQEGLAPRDYQIPIVSALVDPLPSKAVYLQTGKGKTKTALMAVAQMGLRCSVMIPPKYFGIWVEAIEETFPSCKGRVQTVSGSAELKALIERGVEGELDADVIIISQVTYRNYLESYERFGEQIEEIGFLAPPPRFHEAIGAGVQIIDEIQDDPGLVFRMDVFTNIRKQMYLSATPFTGNDYVTNMINVMLPEPTHCPLPKYDAYINVIGLLYGDPEVQRKDYLTPFKNTYNHARYEKQMMKKKRRLTRYHQMVRRVVTGIFTRDRVPGQKLLILCATVDFIAALTKYLNVAFPDLTVGMHVAGSDYRKLLKNDITVSTIKSSGTGVDIPDLREVLMLQATDSKKDNIQVLGRLRHMKNFPDHTPRMTYMVCEHIKPHIKYHNSKKNHFSGRVKNHRVMRL